MRRYGHFKYCIYTKQNLIFCAMCLPYKYKVQKLILSRQDFPQNDFIRVNQANFSQLYLPEARVADMHARQSKVEV